MSEDPIDLREALFVCAVGRPLDRVQLADALLEGRVIEIEKEVLGERAQWYLTY